jgi:hypothetical protein
LQTGAGAGRRPDATAAAVSPSRGGRRLADAAATDATGSVVVITRRFTVTLVVPAARTSPERTMVRRTMVTVPGTVAIATAVGSTVAMVDATQTTVFAMGPVTVTPVSVVPSAVVTT